VCSTCNSHKWRLESHGGMKLCKICKKCYDELKKNYSIQRDLLPPETGGQVPLSPKIRNASARSERRRSRRRSGTQFKKTTSDLQREARRISKKS